MSIEALWLVKFGDMSDPNHTNGGVVVLESERAFGGDSGYFYLGNYKIDRGHVTAKVSVTRHDPQWTNAFGIPDTKFDLLLDGQLKEDHQVVSGVLTLAKYPDRSIPFVLIRAAELP